ncbi:hypothetical protein BGY98DRAFT_1114060 [Russula aff. rugulosa BPL654]|nr:hypothetical protein BGY98DRAFT_1114060 [Russula aff. rugulosa BPL654]
MPPRKTRAPCQICKENESKYTCPASGCLIDYCSVSCYKQHKGYGITEEVPLRPLTSLKWPYLPEESAYPDPLKRDDPKPCRLPTTSSAIRTILREHPKLKDTLRTIDGLRGSAREEALQASIGISTRGDDDDGMGELAREIQGAVRGNRDGLLGLDWSVLCPEKE